VYTNIGCEKSQQLSLSIFIANPKYRPIFYSLKYCSIDSDSFYDLTWQPLSIEDWFSLVLVLHNQDKDWLLPSFHENPSDRGKTRSSAKFDFDSAS